MPIELELCPLCGYKVYMTPCFVYLDYIVETPKIKCPHCGITKTGKVFRQSEDQSDHEVMEASDKLLRDSWNNQTRIKSIEQDLRFACDALHKIAYSEPRSYMDDQGVSLSCEGCNRAAVVALKALRYIPEEYKEEHKNEYKKEYKDENSI